MLDELCVFVSVFLFPNYFKEEGVVYGVLTRSSQLFESLLVWFLMERWKTGNLGRRGEKDGWKWSERTGLIKFSRMPKWQLSFSALAGSQNGITWNDDSRASCGWEDESLGGATS